MHALAQLAWRLNAPGNNFRFTQGVCAVRRDRFPNSILVRANSFDGGERRVRRRRRHSECLYGCANVCFA